MSTQFHQLFPTVCENILKSFAKLRDDPAAFSARVPGLPVR
jgi:hypothetical protein